ncbi:hypothetical protein CJF32_00009830 [Rutstroemia sp. NJR-2017a WRK4]|nr:hypothetical protein CJF32_00009830 [Rutstroemia sp. NJR-2017a WRK4]
MPLINGLKMACEETGKTIERMSSPQRSTMRMWKRYSGYTKEASMSLRHRYTCLDPSSDTPTSEFDTRRGLAYAAFIQSTKDNIETAVKQETIIRSCKFGEDGFEPGQHNAVRSTRAKDTDDSTTSISDVKSASVQFGGIPSVPLQHPQMHNLGEIKTNGFGNGHAGLDQVVESPLETPTEFKNGQITPKMNGGSCCTPAVKESPPDFNNGVSVSSCCAPKQNGHSHTPSNSSSISEPQPQQSLPKSGGCCSSKKNQPLMPKPMPNPINSQNGFAMNSFSQFPATVFTYPPTYGSYQNPLQPSAWAQGVRDMSFAQQPIPTAPLAFDPNAAPISENLETIHTCGCGDACQCIGCAAHPYNDATQDYVRSAWASMQIDQSDAYPTGNVASLPLQTQDIKENPTSPPPATPSSTGSGNAEEQTLSASDFFFRRVVVGILKVVLAEMIVNV